MQPVAELLGLQKRYGARLALDDLSFAVAPGEIVALLGPNGAGKTTLIGCLLGFLLPGAGSASMFGTDVSALSPEQRGRVGFVPQAMTGFGWFRVGELIRYLDAFHVSAAAPGDPLPVDDALLAWAGLDMKARVKSLSGGERQRLAILLALRHRPDFLVLDEPVASLDPQARRDFMALLAGYCAQHGRSALISSHILSDLEKVATRAVFLARGRIVLDTPMARFRNATRWLIPADGAAAGPLLRAALPDGLTLLGQDAARGAVLVEGWTEAAATALQAASGITVRIEAPDLETVFLEMTR